MHQRESEVQLNMDLQQSFGIPQNLSNKDSILQNAWSQHNAGINQNNGEGWGRKLWPYKQFSFERVQTQGKPSKKRRHSQVIKFTGRQLFNDHFTDLKEAPQSDQNEQIVSTQFIPKQSKPNEDQFRHGIKFLKAVLTNQSALIKFLKHTCLQQLEAMAKFRLECESNWQLIYQQFCQRKLNAQFIKQQQYENKIKQLEELIINKDQTIEDLEKKILEKDNEKLNLLSRQDKLQSLTKCSSYIYGKKKKASSFQTEQQRLKVFQANSQKVSQKIHNLITNLPKINSKNEGSLNLANRFANGDQNTYFCNLIGPFESDIQSKLEMHDNSCNLLQKSRSDIGLLKPPSIWKQSDQQIPEKHKPASRRLKTQNIIPEIYKTDFISPQSNMNSSRQLTSSRRIQDIGMKLKKLKRQMNEQRGKLSSFSPLKNV